MNIKSKNGKREIRLDAVERRLLENARKLCHEIYLISDNWQRSGSPSDDLLGEANDAWQAIAGILELLPDPNPKPGQAPSEQAKAKGERT